MVYPESLNNLIHSFELIPGVGEKSAERFALSILEKDEEQVSEFANNLSVIKHQIKNCKICNFISDTEICPICNDKLRNKNTICVVEDYKSVFRFENSGNYQGQYHILGGLISPINGVFPDDINISTLKERVLDLKGDIELIVALTPSVEGDTTTLYIKELFKDLPVKVTRLSYGIPMGVEIDYLDPITIERALNDRKDV